MAVFIPGVSLFSLQCIRVLWEKIKTVTASFTTAFQMVSSAWSLRVLKNRLNLQIVQARFTVSSCYCQAKGAALGRSRVFMSESMEGIARSSCWNVGMAGSDDIPASFGASLVNRSPQLFLLCSLSRSACSCCMWPCDHMPQPQGSLGCHSPPSALFEAQRLDALFSCIPG